MKIIKSKESSWIDKQGYSKKILLNDKNNKVIVQKVKIKPGETAKYHHHKIQTEIFYFLSENGKWKVNNLEISIKAGDILVIEPMDMHEVENNSTEDYIYLAFKINFIENDSYWS
jgi:quercetin dioxygenase-like cupin family protein